MSVANKFLEELLSGKIEEAISTIQSDLKEKTDNAITEARTEILESYGFESLSEKEEDEDEDDSDDKDDKEDESDDKEGKEDE